MAEISVSDYTTKAWASICNIGPIKAGKTSSIITMHDYLCEQPPEMPRTIALFDLDEDGAYPVIEDAKRRGWTNQLRIFRYREPGRRIENSVYPTRSSEEWIQLTNDLNAFDNLIDYNTKWWSTEALESGQAPGCIVLDGASGLEEMTWDYILRTRNKEIASGKGASVEYDEWRLLQEKFQEIIRTVKSWPCHFVLNFHEQFAQETAPPPAGSPKDVRPVLTGKAWYQPMIYGRLAGKVGKMFSVVMHSRSSNGRYEWIIQPTDEERIKGAGTRFKRGSDLASTIDQDYRILLG